MWGHSEKVTICETRKRAEEKPNLLIPCSWTSSFQNFEKILFKLPNLTHFVMANITNKYIHLLIISQACVNYYLFCLQLGEQTMKGGTRHTTHCEKSFPRLFLRISPWITTMFVPNDPITPATLNGPYSNLVIQTGEWSMGLSTRVLVIGVLQMW